MVSRIGATCSPGQSSVSGHEFTVHNIQIKTLNKNDTTILPKYLFDLSRLTTNSLDNQTDSPLLNNIVNKFENENETQLNSSLNNLTNLSNNFDLENNSDNSLIIINHTKNQTQSILPQSSPTPLSSSTTVATTKFIPTNGTIPVSLDESTLINISYLNSSNNFANTLSPFQQSSSSSTSTTTVSSTNTVFF